MSTWWRRRDMEDAVSVRPDFGGGFLFYGVFDGHGCFHVRTCPRRRRRYLCCRCQDRMHEVVAKELERLATIGRPKWEVAMGRSFTRMDAEVGSFSGGGGDAAACRCEQQEPGSSHVGSTEVIAVVSRERNVVANCGDSHAVLRRGGAAVPLSVDHKPDRPGELDRHATLLPDACRLPSPVFFVVITRESCNRAEKIGFRKFNFLSICWNWFRAQGPAKELGREQFVVLVVVPALFIFSADFWSLPS